MNFETGSCRLWYISMRCENRIEMSYRSTGDYVLHSLDVDYFGSELALSRLSIYCCSPSRDCVCVL